MNSMLHNLDFDSMTVEERLELIEAIWASLERGAGDDLPVSAWQRDELEKRLAAYRSGRSVGSPMDEVMDRLLGKS